MHAGDERVGGGDVAISEQNVLEIVIAGRQNRSALIDLGGIEQIEYGKMLDREHAVHAFEAQTTLAIQEVRDMSLLESGLLREAKSGQIAFINALPKSIAEIVLQHSEFHSWEYSMRYISIR